MKTTSETFLLALTIDTKAGKWIIKEILTECEAQAQSRICWEDCSSELGKTLEILKFIFTCERSHTVFPATNSMIPEINWHIPPKNTNTPTKIFFSTMPRAWTPSIESRNTPVANDKRPKGAGFAKLRWIIGSEGWSRLSIWPPLVRSLSRSGSFELTDWRLSLSSYWHFRPWLDMIKR